MRKFFVLLFIFTVLFAAPIVTPQAFAQNAACDLCGYCEGYPPPSNWAKCRDCIYPGAAGANADQNLTLKLNLNPLPGQDVAPTPAPGQFYLSMLGTCVATAGGFTSQGSAGALTQVLLDVIFGIAGGIAFLYILYGSVQVATSQNDPEKLNYGKRLIIGAVVGLVVSLSAVFLVNLIGSQILKIPGFGT